jgi:hypothetical protein
MPVPVTAQPAPDAVAVALDYASSQQVEDVVWSKLKIAACAEHAATVKAMEATIADAKAMFGYTCLGFAPCCMDSGLM